MKFLYLLMLIAVLLFMGCAVNDDDTSAGEPDSIMELDIPDDFDYSTQQDVNLQISLQSTEGEGVAGIVYDLYYIDENDEAQLIRSNMTNSAGILNSSLTLPSFVTQLKIQGFMETVMLDIVDGAAYYEFIATENMRNVVEEDFSFPERSRNFSYLPGVTYNYWGVPNPYTEYPISDEMLTRVDTSLPEGVSLPQSHPQYLEDNITTNFVITDSSDVWLTFVTEGAGHKNALGFYTYDLNEGPPDDPQDLDHVLVFPNVSKPNSGGALYPGTQVHLGKFGADTVMGWFLVANGWQWGANVDENDLRLYSDRQYNPEEEEYNQHQVLLYDAESELFLLGFEDLVRPAGDNDFNDAVFFVTANPIENIDTSEIPPIDIPVDSDGDGVNDPFDEFPDDPDRAFYVYFPAVDETGTLVFEDKWPQYGDYDMNDMVLDYKYTLVTNGDDEVKDMKMEFKLRAAGAFYNNGFSVQIPFEFSNTTLATSSDNLNPSLDSDGDYTIVDLFTSVSGLTGLSTGTFINTQADAAYYEPFEFFSNLTFTDPVLLEDLDFGFPYNPFVRRSGSNEHEIHLMDFPPTGRQNLELFMTEDDFSDPAAGSYYVSPENLPWGLNLAESWKYPLERSSIVEAYLNFSAWAESGGETNQDWYLYNEDNVAEEKVYQQP